MQDLNAQQIVLLTLLVSFVTSIATGITTVSLLEQAPEPVTQTINRVVEKTVERVVEVEGENNTPVEKIVETVVVNAEDLTTEAVAQNSSNLVRIYSKTGDLKNFVVLGIVVSVDGDVLTDSRSIVPGTKYIVDYPSGEKEVNIKYREANNQFALLSVSSEATAEGESFSRARFANSQNIKLAQSVIALSGQTNNIVSTGIVTSIETTDGVLDSSDSSATPSSEIVLIDTSVDGAKVVRGAILLNLNGEIIGAKINGDPNRITAFIPSNQITSFLNSQNQSVAVENTNTTQ